MDSQGQVSILDYWRVVWHARWFILALTGLAAVGAFGAGRLQPKVYVAKATILPPKEPAVASSFSLGGPGMSFLGGGGGGQGAGGMGLLPSLALGTGSLTPNLESFVALLRSRTMRTDVLAQLAERWGPSVGEMVVSIQPDIREKGVIGLTAEAKDPALAADLANLYFVTLDRTLERYANETMEQDQQVYTAQLERAAREVQVAEEALLAFQAKNRALATSADQSKVAGGSASLLRDSILALEMQREVLRMRFTDLHPQFRELQKQIIEMKKQYSRNLFGDAMDLPPEGPNARGPRKEFFVPAAKMTPLEFEFVKLFRKLKIQEAFYAAALQGLQQIKYADLNSPRVKVLDPAIPPGAPSRPNVVLITAVAAISAFIIGILLTFARTYLRHLREEESRIRPLASARPAREVIAGAPDVRVPTRAH